MTTEDTASALPDGDEAATSAPSLLAFPDWLEQNKPEPSSKYRGYSDYVAQETLVQGKYSPSLMDKLNTKLAGLAVESGDYPLAEGQTEYVPADVLARPKSDEIPVESLLRKAYSSDTSEDDPLRGAVSKYEALRRLRDEGRSTPEEFAAAEADLRQLATPEVMNAATRKDVKDGFSLAMVVPPADPEGAPDVFVSKSLLEFVNPEDRSIDMAALGKEMKMKGTDPSLIPAILAKLTTPDGYGKTTMEMEMHGDDMSTLDTLARTADSEGKFGVYDELQKIANSRELGNNYAAEFGEFRLKQLTKGTPLEGKDLMTLADDFNASNAMPEIDPADPAKALRTLSTGQVVAPMNLMLDDAKFATALKSVPLAQQEHLKAQRDYAVTVSAADTITALANSPEYGEAFTEYMDTQRSAGKKDAEIVKGWVAKGEFSTSGSLLGATPQFLVDAFVTPIWFLATGADPDGSAMKAMQESQIEHSQRKAYAELMGNPHGMGYDLAQLVAPMAVDIGLSFLAGAGVATAGARITSTTLAKGLMRSFLRESITAGTRASFSGWARRGTTALAESGFKSAGIKVTGKETVNEVITMAGRDITAKMAGGAAKMTFYGTAFTRSATSTYASLSTALSNQKNPDGTAKYSPEEVKEISMPHAIAAGAITVGAMGAMAGLGAPGIEKIFGEAGKTSAGQMSRIMGRLKKDVSKLPAGIDTTSANTMISSFVREGLKNSIFKSTVVRGTAEEIPEEGLDAFMGYFNEKMALGERVSIPEALKGAMYAGMLGGIMGGTVTGISGYAKNRTAPSARVEADIRRERLLDMAGKLEATSPQTAQVFRNYAFQQRSLIPQRQQLEGDLKAAKTPEAKAAIQTKIDTLNEQSTRSRTEELAPPEENLPEADAAEGTVEAPVDAGMAPEGEAVAEGTPEGSAAGGTGTPVAPYSEEGITQRTPEELAAKEQEYKVILRQSVTDPEARANAEIAQQGLDRIRAEMTRRATRRTLGGFTGTPVAQRMRATRETVETEFSDLVEESPVSAEGETAPLSETQSPAQDPDSVVSAVLGQSLDARLARAAKAGRDTSSLTKGFDAIRNGSFATKAKAALSHLYDTIRIAEDTDYAAYRVTEAAAAKAGESSAKTTARSENGWFYRGPSSLFSAKGWGGKKGDTKFSANVTFSETLLAEMDSFVFDLQQEGVDAYYKVPDQAAGWDSRHDPLSLYASGALTQEQQARLTSILTPHARAQSPSLNKLTGRKVADGVFEDANPSKNDLDALITRAEALGNADLTKAIRDYIGTKASTGQVAAANSLLDQITAPTAPASAATQPPTPAAPKVLTQSTGRGGARDSKRQVTQEGIDRVDAAKQRVRDIVNNKDLVGKQRADAIAKGNKLISFLDARADTRKPLKTIYFKGDLAAFDGEDAPDGFQSIIMLEGANAGDSRVVSNDYAKSYTTEQYVTTAPTPSDTLPNTKDPLEALIEQLKAEDATPTPEKSIATASESGRTQTFEYQMQVAQQVAAIAGYLPAPRPERRAETTTIPSGPVIHLGTLNEEKTSAIIDEVLTDSEKVEAAQELGQKKWNAAAKKKFGERMADWVASGKEVSDKLVAMFNKVWKAITLAGITGIIAVSPTINAPNMTIVKITNSQLAELRSPKFNLPELNPELPMFDSQGGNLGGLSPFEEVDAYKNRKFKAIKASDDSSVGDTPSVPKVKMPPMVGEVPTAGINFKGVGHTTNARVIAEWVLMKGDNKGKPFLVADKSSGAVYVFDGKGEFLLRAPALFGRNKGDVVLTKGVSHRTPSGRFDAEIYESQDYGTALRFHRVESNNFLAHRVPSHSRTNPPAARRAALASESPLDNRGTSGCMNFDLETIDFLTEQFSDGGVFYITPETETGKAAFDGFKNVELPSDDNNVSLNEAGLDPISAFLLTLAGLALNRKKAGRSKQAIQGELDTLIEQSRFSPEKKAAVLAKISEVLTQSFAFSPPSTSSDTLPGLTMPPRKRSLSSMRDATVDKLDAIDRRLARAEGVDGESYSVLEAGKQRLTALLGQIETVMMTEAQEARARAVTPEGDVRPSADPEDIVTIAEAADVPVVDVVKSDIMSTAQGVAKDMTNIVTEARDIQQRFLSERGMTMEQARLLNPEGRDALQRDYDEWLKSNGEPATPQIPVNTRDTTYESLLKKGIPAGPNMVELTEKQVTPATRNKLRSDRDTQRGLPGRPEETSSFYLRPKADVTGVATDRGWILKDKRPDFIARSQSAPTASRPKLSEGATQTIIQSRGVGNFSGPSNADVRAAIMSEIEDKKVPKSKAGFNAFVDAVANHFGVTKEGKTSNAYEKAINQAVKDSAAPAPAQATTGTGKPQKVGNTGAIPTAEESARWDAAEAYARDHVNNLSDDALDTFGEAVGTKRQGVGDEAYRAKIIENTHPDDLLDAISPSTTPTISDILADVPEGYPLDRDTAKLVSAAVAMPGGLLSAMAANPVVADAVKRYAAAKGIATEGMNATDLAIVVGGELEADTVLAALRGDSVPAAEVPEKIAAEVKSPLENLETAKQLQAELKAAEGKYMKEQVLQKASNDGTLQTSLIALAEAGLRIPKIASGLLAGDTDTPLTFTGDSIILKPVTVKKPEDAVVSHASIDQDRYVLNGVYYDADAQAVVATDGRRLAVIPAKVTGKSRIVATHDVKKPKSREIAHKKGTVIDGNYPNWKQVVPDTKGYTKTEIDIESVRRRAAVGASLVSMIEVKGAPVTPASLQTPNGSVLNPSFVQDAVETLVASGAKTITLETLGTNDPVVFRGDNGAYVVVMAIRVAGYRGFASAPLTGSPPTSTPRNLPSSTPSSAVTQELDKFGFSEGLPAFLANVAKRGGKQYSAIAKLLLEVGAGNVDIRLVNLPNTEAAGFYVGANGVVHINTAKNGPRGAVDTVLHELVHAVTEGSLKNPTPAQQKIIARIERVRATVTKRAKANGTFDNDLQYALGSNAEFLTHFFTSQKFRDQVSAMTPKSEKNWIQVIADLIADLFTGRTQAQKMEAELRKELTTLITAPRIGLAPSDVILKLPANDVRFLPSRQALRVRLTREALTQLALDQASWKDWYSQHQETLDEFFGNHAEMFQDILAATSQAATVKSNVGLALKAFGQITRGEPIEGFLPAVRSNLERLRDKLQLEGQKISAYQKANAGDIEQVVVDRHISRMLFGVDSPSKAQFEKGVKVLSDIARKIGWKPSQVQAALWAASIVKSGKTPQSYADYLRKLEDDGVVHQRIGIPTGTGTRGDGIGGGRGRYSPGVQQGGVRFQPTSDARNVARFHQLTESLYRGRDIVTAAEIEAWKAANVGAWEELSAMREDVLRAGGWDVKAYHGTPEAGFTEFQEGAAFFSDKSGVAESYTMLRGLWLSKGKNPKVIPAALKFSNPLEIDALGKRWDNIPFPGVQWKPKAFGNLPSGAIKVNEATRRAFEMGHDAVIIRNVLDSVDQQSREKSTVYAVSNPTQIKSADPISPGEKITPDRWADAASPDIRFQPAARNTDADYLAAVEAGDIETAQRMVYDAAGVDTRLWDAPPQTITSADTSINDKKTAATFTKVKFTAGTINADIGGGRFDNATIMLKAQGVRNVIFDPFNRREGQNMAAASRIRDGQSDTTTVNNVLNVIQDAANRDKVIRQAANAVKPDGTSYFLVYEGNGSGVGRVTSKGWQENRKTKDYLDEVKAHYGNVRVKNGIIEATNPIKGRYASEIYYRGDIPIGLGTDPAISAVSDFGADKGQLRSVLRDDVKTKDLKYPNVIDRNPIYLTSSTEDAYYFASSIGYANDIRKFFVEPGRTATPEDLNRVFGEANAKGLRDANGNEFFDNKQTVSYLTSEEVDLLVEAGYDSAAGQIDGRGGKEIAVFSPSQIKSADPVTYDEQGNVIPLSQRFNPQSSDIRFQPAASPVDKLVEKGHTMLREDFDAEIAKLKPMTRDVFYVGDIEVVRNPTSADYQTMTKEVRSEFGRDLGGDPDIRFTQDQSGNRWIWKAYQGMHPQVEPGISRREGVAVNQNAAPPLHSEVIRQAIRDTKFIPEEVKAQYPQYAEFFNYTPTDIRFQGLTEQDFAPANLRNTAAGFLPDDVTLDDLTIDFTDLADITEGLDPVNAENVVHAAVNHALARRAGEAAIPAPVRSEFDSDEAFDAATTEHVAEVARLTDTYELITRGRLTSEAMFRYRTNPGALTRLVDYLTAAIKAAYNRFTARYDVGTAVALNRMSRDLAKARKGFNHDIEPMATYDPDAVMMLPAYHGTPHVVDRFSTDFIGTGEGAQAYGWGLYFTQTEGIARDYRDTLSQAANTRVDLKVGEETWSNQDVINDFTFEDDMVLREVARWMSSEVRNGRPADLEMAVKAVRDGARLDQNQSKVDLIDALSAKGINPVILPQKASRGSLYTVDIKIEDDEFLDWDQSLLEQSEGVKRKLGALWEDLNQQRERNAPGMMRPATGGDLYQHLEETFAEELDAAEDNTPAAQVASKSLYTAGIKGIRYLDGVSRNRPYKDIKRDFLNALPEDAEFEDVQNAIENNEFAPEQVTFLKALEADDWFGFDYPAQAISAALTDRAGSFEPSQALTDSIDVLRGDVSYNYVVFDGKDVEITHANGEPIPQNEWAGLDQNEASGIRFQPAADNQGFYSQLEQVVSAKVPNRATPQQIMATIDPTRGSGVKAEEIKWSGIEQALTNLAVDGKVSKDDLMKYLADEGNVRFEEVTLGKGIQSRYTAVRFGDIPQGGRYEVPGNEEADPRDWVLMDGGSPAYLIGEPDVTTEGEALALMDSVMLDEGDSLGSTKFGQYVLFGGENYREVVLAMPLEEGTRYVIKQHDYIGESQDDPNETWFTIKNVVTGKESNAFETREEAEALLKENGKGKLSDPTYTSSHFPDVPNYVAHMRTNERDGGLFIEEIQSDRHQAGRKKGYDNERGVDIATREFNRIVKPNKDVTSKEMQELVLSTNARMIEWAKEKLGEDYDRIRELAMQDGPSIADAPFRTTWPLAMFKRALRDAVAGGKDWIGWTVGATQGDRFDLSKQLQAVEWNELSGEFTAYPIDGGLTINETGVTAEKLVDLIGKDAAEKLVDSRVQPNGDRMLEGDQLKIEATGMKGFYDNMLPKEIGKYVKQWGAKVEKTDIGTSGDASLNAEREYSYDAVDSILRRGGEVYFVNDAGQEENISDYEDAANYIEENGTPRGFIQGDVGPTTPIWRIDITPAMRESVSTQGQVLFQPSVQPASPARQEQQLLNAEAPMQRVETLFKRDPGTKAGADITPSENKVIRRLTEFFINPFGALSRSNTKSKQNRDAMMETVEYTVSSLSKRLDAARRKEDANPTLVQLAVGNIDPLLTPAMQEKIADDFVNEVSDAEQEIEATYEEEAQTKPIEAAENRAVALAEAHKTAERNRQKAIWSARSAEADSRRAQQLQALAQLERTAPDTYEAIIDLRGTVNRLQRLVKEANPESPEIHAIVDQSFGVYLVRSYGIHQDPKQIDLMMNSQEKMYVERREALTAFFKGKAFDEIMSELDKDPQFFKQYGQSFDYDKALADMRRIAEAESGERAQQMFEDYMLSRQSARGTFGEGSTVTNEIQRYMAKANMPQEFLDALMVNEDPVFNIANTAMSLGRLVFNSRMLNEIYDSGIESGRLITEAEFKTGITYADGKEEMRRVFGTEGNDQVKLEILDVLVKHLNAKAQEAYDNGRSDTPPDKDALYVQAAQAMQDFAATPNSQLSDILPSLGRRADRTATDTFISSKDLSRESKAKLQARPGRFAGWQPLVTTNVGNSAFKPLGGMYAEPEQVKAFNATFRINSNGIGHFADDFVAKAHRLVIAGAGASLLVATQGSPAYFVRNVVGNTFVGLMNGVTPFRPENLTLAGRTFRNLINERGEPTAEMQELIAGRIVMDAAQIGYIKQLIEDYTGNPDATVEELVGESARADIKAGKLVKGSKKAAKAFMTKLSKLSEATEVLATVMIYADFKRILTDAEFGTEIEIIQEASRLTKRVTPGRSETASGVTALTRSGFGALFAPFLRFKVDTVRVMVNSLKLAHEMSNSDNPVLKKHGRIKMASWYSTVGLLTIAMPLIFQRAVGGFGDDEDEAIRASLPSYYRNASLFYFRNSENNGLTIINSTFTNPLSFIGDPISRITNAVLFGDASDIPGIMGRFVTEDFIGENIVASNAIDVMRNKDSSTNYPIYFEADSDGDKVLKSAIHLGKAYTPRLFIQGDRFVDSLRREGDEEFWYSPLGVALATVAPFRPMSKTFDDMERAAFNNIRKENSELWRVTSPIFSPAPLAAGEATEKYNDRVTIMEKQARKALELYDGFTKIRGGDEAAVKRSAVNAGMSKRRAALLFNQGLMEKQVFPEDDLRRVREIDPARYDEIKAAMRERPSLSPIER